MTDTGPNRRRRLPAFIPLISNAKPREMSRPRIIIALLCFVLCRQAVAQDMKAELVNLTERLAVIIKDKGMAKVAVVDFTDLQGGSSELGKYIAEQMTVDLVMTNRIFSVLDRANLKRILAEHELIPQSLMDPGNAKKIGMLAGVNAIIVGTIIPQGEHISLTARIITTETEEIVGEAKAGFKTDDTIKQLMSRQTSGGSAGGTGNETARVTKKLGDLSVGLQSLQIVNGGRQYLLTLTLANISPQKSIWVSLRGGKTGNAQGTIIDRNGFEFVSTGGDVSGVASSSTETTEIKPGNSISVTIKFHSLPDRKTSAGRCEVQLEFLLGTDLNNVYGQFTSQKFVAGIDAE